MPGQPGHAQELGARPPPAHRGSANAAAGCRQAPQSGIGSRGWASAHYGSYFGPLSFECVVSPDGKSTRVTVDCPGSRNVVQNKIPRTLDNAVDSAASLYMDIINLFLRILGRRR